MSKSEVTFVLGGPGASKGTNCERLVNELGFVHISAGDCLREERSNPESQVGQLIDSYIKEGAIVPVKITVSLLKKKMDNHGHGRFLIDGFPRNEENMRGWEEVIGDSVKLKGCLFLDCTEDEMERRLLKRGETSGRTDDNIESIRKRFRTYQVETRPIIELFEKKGLVMHVDANNERDAVWQQVLKHMA